MITVLLIINIIGKPLFLAPRGRTLYIYKYNCNVYIFIEGSGMMAAAGAAAAGAGGVDTSKMSKFQMQMSGQWNQQVCIYIEIYM
jgi:hypothetical protein